MAAICSVICVMEIHRYGLYRLYTTLFTTILLTGLSHQQQHNP